MSRIRLLFAGSPEFVLLLSLLLTSSCGCKAQETQHYCSPSSCGNIPNISTPFRLKGDPKNCGDPRYELDCENNRTVLYWHNFGRFYVEAISYVNFSIRIVDPGLQKDNCSSFPINYPSPLYDIGFEYYSEYEHRYEYYGGYDDSYWLPYNQNSLIVFISCADPVSSTRYVETSSCSNKATSPIYSLPLSQNHSYVAIGDLVVSDLEHSCGVSMMTFASSLAPIIHNNSFSNIHDGLMFGFELSWRIFLCGKCFANGSDYCSVDVYNNASCVQFERLFKAPSSCKLNKYLQCGIEFAWDYIIYFFKYGHPQLIGKYVGYALAARNSCGILCLITWLVYKLTRRHLSTDDSIEEFLQSHNNLTPIRYSYSDIMKMTYRFNEKLGEGGYGTVYKGKLRSGSLVAVKMMGKSKTTGQEFINEVATIGRIHHFNVVPLIGFCAQGSKRALVYDFMPNGSLEKYIFPREGQVSLNFQKMYDISLGVARGIEYLHRGCDMQILHFDIKPHNILLNKNFIPKVSDFGLAKLYPTKDSIVSLTAARGTMGYMAPELFYKNIGGISYKADVYSFGMLLMEMTGRRKNLNPFADNPSQIYFPSWAYDQLSEGKDLEIGVATEEERKMVNKMIIVALWCIQMKPTDRPPMNKVVEMLEGDVELLRMPPKPSLSPQEMPTEV